MTILIKEAQEKDFKVWFELRKKLWPNYSESLHRQEIASDFEDSTKSCLLVFLEGKAIGMAELSLRSIVDGCRSTPVSYLEGWYIQDQYRGQGIGRSLMEAAENWGKEQGCVEMGSDSELNNNLSIAIHKKLGFEEVDRIVQFRKSL